MTEKLDPRYPVGAEFKVSGTTKELWIKGCKCTLSTYATIVKQPLTTDKKVMVRLDYLACQRDVFVYIRKSALKPI